MPERREDLAREIGDRGLAGGAGDGDDRLRRARIEARRGGRQRGSRIGDDDRGHAERFVRLPLGDDRHRARLDGALGISEAVRLRSRHREEQIARLHGAAVEREPGDRQARRSRRKAGAAQELGERHRRPCLSRARASETGARPASLVSTSKHPITASFPLPLAPGAGMAAEAGRIAAEVRESGQRAR